jgi:hypothetical protein
MRERGHQQSPGCASSAALQIDEMSTNTPPSDLPFLHINFKTRNHFFMRDCNIPGADMALSMPAFLKEMSQMELPWALLSTCSSGPGQVAIPVPQFLSYPSKEEHLPRDVKE